jgi:hypothetical protein
MRKLLILLCVFTLVFCFSSCSGNDDATVTQQVLFSYKLDGTTTTFYTGVVYPLQRLDNVSLEVTASNGTAVDFVSFNINQNDYTIGNYWFLINGVSYSSRENFHTDVIVSDAHQIKGTFSGTIFQLEDGAEHTITEGTFDIRY